MDACMGLYGFGDERWMSAEVNWRDLQAEEMAEAVWRPKKARRGAG